MAQAPMMEKASAGMKELFSALSSSEARYFDEERFSESEIRKSLSDSLTDRKIDAMKRILAAVSVGRDASSLFPDVVKNVSFQSLELKKLIYIYLVQYAENNRELALLSINSFQKDLMDRSQQVRASALRAMASIKVLEVIQLVMVAVKTAANDTSPYVRKTAAQCMTKVYAVDNDQFPELRKLLLKLMNDVEVQVVGSAVMAFRHICVVQPPRAPAEAGADEDDVQGADKSNKVTDEVLRPQLEHLHQHFKRLVQDMLLMDSWAQQCCIDLLMRYARLFFACPNRQKDASDQAAAAEGGESPAAPVVSEDFQLLVKNLKLLLFSASKGVTLAAAVALCYLAPSEELSGLAMPLLRCLRQATPESSIALLTAMTPLVEAKPELFRPMIREFFVQSLQPADAKQLKLKIMELLVDESNVQLVLRELQAYVSWHSQPEFVAQAVQCIAQVALKISSVADSCLRGLVKMLDSKCEALSCEAVVSLRALLQRRQRSEDSGLGSVLPHLVSYLEDLKAPTARASVVWIIGHYQQEVPRLAPDVVRRMAKCFATERQEVKQQILTLSLKVWAFHTLNARGDAITGQADDSSASSKSGPRVSVEESAQLLPRLEAIVDHIGNLAAFDAAWDVRDTARALKKVKEVAKGCLAAGTEGSSDTEKLGVWYCRACVSGTPPVDADGVDASALETLSKGNSSQAVESTWILGSLAQVLDFPLETYRPLPGWAEENSSDELRKVKAEEAAAAQARKDAPKSISSASVGNISHMENRVQQPSNIKDMPVVSSLEDLDLFYSEAPPPSAGAAASNARPAGAAGSEQAPATTLEQVRLSGPVAPVGTAVFGEDDESDEEEEASEEEDDSWKYCQQAAAPSAPAAPSSDPAVGGFSPPARAGEAKEEEVAAAPAVEAEPAAAADEAQPDTTQPAAAPALSPETMDLI
eukprot:TRINITY_DN72538_c0_g1_i1.p1 TRINITY_DN72538_c0_g1~~TRINITY_DN72538_c0_g1_i1.p1  ORF type:complete len:960 (+),score=280.87 TRINITY_DN72538_c0_g1_i1:92-2881(+)